MFMRRLMDQQLPPNSIIHNSLRCPSLPTLENMHYLPIKPLWRKESIYHGIFVPLCLCVFVTWCLVLITHTMATYYYMYYLSIENRKSEIRNHCKANALKYNDFCYHSGTYQS